MNPRIRQFVAGERGVAGGVNWRIIQGRKAPDDLVIEWYLGDRWLPVSLDIIFVAVDFICQNEDRLYPHPLKGGEYTIRAIGKARHDGHEYATGWLHLQRQNREAKARKDWVA